MKLRLPCALCILLEIGLSGAASAPSTQQLANRFPEVVREVLASDARAGTEAQFFARLANLMDGAPMPPALRRVSPEVDHLAHAQADLDRGDLLAAVTEARAVRGGNVLTSWLNDAESRLALNPQRPGAKIRIARAKPARSTLAMPTEIPPYARESSGPVIR